MEIPLTEIKPLSVEAQELRRKILAEYESDPAFIAVLDQGIAAWDLARACQAIIDTQGLTVHGDRGGLKAHPLLDVLKSARSQFFASFKQLRLDMDAEDLQRGPGRPTAGEEARKQK